MLPNLTLIIQILAFAAVAWLVMKFGWPPLMAAIEERQKKIAEGLAAGEKAQKELAQAQSSANEILKDAHARAAKIVEQANRRSTELVDEARDTALTEGKRLVNEAQQEVTLQTGRAREQLRKEVAGLVVAGTSQLLGREVDARAHADLLEKLALEIERG